MLGLRKRSGFSGSGGLGALVAGGRHLGPTLNTPSVIVEKNVGDGGVCGL